MATYRERDGRWQAIVRTRTFKGSETFGRKAEAQAWARKKEREDDLAKSDIVKMTGALTSVVERYEKEMYPVKRWGLSKTKELEALKRDLGSWRLDQFTKTKLLKYARELGLAPSGVAGRLTYLREVFKCASDLWELPMPIEVVSDALTAAYRLKIAGTSKVRTRRATQAELDAIMGWARDNVSRHIIDLETVVRMQSVMPLRIGELLAIEWVDLFPGSKSALLRERKHPDVLEHEANNQDVPFITFGGTDTWEILSTRPEYYPRPFPYRETSTSDLFHKACVALRIDNLRLHDLRAHAISNLLEAELSIPFVAKLSGHRDWKVLARVYARLQADKVHQALAKQVAAAPSAPAPTPPQTSDDGPT